MADGENELDDVADAQIAEGPDASMEDVLGQQDEEAVAFAAEFLKKVIRIRGVRVERATFLSQELRKLSLDQATIDCAVSATPVQAGISVAQLDELAVASIVFETNKATAMSFTAGLPGGFAILASVPADITQYYVHAFRVMQKLSYFYGWQNFIDDLDEVDDETLGKLAVFLGVMMGVGGASASLTTFAVQVARPALQKQITQKALTQTAWYGPLKTTLKLIGVKVTKDSFARTVTKSVPLAGGVISGGMTLVSLRTQAGRLKEHLRRLPPPGVDAAEYESAVSAGDEKAGDAAGRFTAVRESFEGAAGNAASGVKAAARGVWGSAEGAGGNVLARGRKLVAKGKKIDQDPESPDGPVSMDAQDSES